MGIAKTSPMDKPIIGSGAYPWLQKYGTSPEELDNHLPEIFTQLVDAGLNAWEPFFRAPGGLDLCARIARDHGISIVSTYENVELHGENPDPAIEAVLRGCVAAREFGLRVFVCNPVPLQWGKSMPKDDTQLRRQAKALQKLGAALRAEDIALAYHMHTPELETSARELHHMMLATDPKDVGMCLDSHWIYRGAGNSHVALEDIVQLYGQRIVSLHLRQSRNGIWHDTLEEGDIDHAWLGNALRRHGFEGPVILELAIEKGTPANRDWTERHRLAFDHVHQCGIA